MSKYTAPLLRSNEVQVIMHSLYRLAEYPVLAALAHKVTEATKLDGRACQYLYEAALPGIDWPSVSARELAFMRSLGIEVNSGR
ncbi:MAG: hypothetical protein FWD62_15670 [Betaproteobacteria bacterium]|nr:hypothetical protein [Betaproteobacteria bacterium]